ncbi:MAG: 3-dehydroquinate synthase [Candidatus Omnitrophica bacterium]|nr:3-dehydroquinate synthase [Candidatus Omnitrophota bacterium]
MNSYDILLGSGHLARLGQEIKRLQLGTHAVILTNPTIQRASGLTRQAAASIRRAGFEVKSMTIPDTERSKSFTMLGTVLSRLASWDGPGRKLFLVLIGGGVVGDLGGVAAGIYRRGIPFVQVPTTLLAQVDSSIGGKTGIDLPHGKNLVGLFVQPRLVFIDLEFLKTLPDRQFRSGLAEVVKCAVIRDAALFRFLEATPLSALRSSTNRLGWVISRAILVKRWAVEQDEKETRSIRTLLNFGHTFGHALEAATRYGTAYTHGEAVSVGMKVAADIALRLNKIGDSELEKIQGLLRHAGLPQTVRGVKEADLLKAMAQDKKWSIGRNRWVLPTGIGRAIVQTGVPDRIVRLSIRSVLER